MPVLVHCWPRGSEVGKTIYALKSRIITRAVHAVRTMHHQECAACRARARRAALCGYRVALLYYFKAVYAYRAAQSGPREFCFLCYHKGQTFERLNLTLRTVLYKVVFCHKAVHRFETARRRSPGQEDTLEEEEEMNHTFY